MKIIIVNEQDKILGYKERGERTENDIVRVSGVYIFNSNKEILIAQRAMSKQFNPGKWGPAVAGTLDEGETYASNAVKETREEIGVEIKEGDLIIGPYEFVKTQHSYFRQMYYTKLDLDISQFIIQKEEVDGLKWVDYQELENWLKNSPHDFTESSPKLMTEFISFLKNTNLPK